MAQKKNYTNNILILIFLAIFAYQIRNKFLAPKAKPEVNPNPPEAVELPKIVKEEPQKDIAPPDFSQILEFISYSRFDQAQQTDTLTNKINQALNSKMSSKNFNSDTLRQLITLKDCKPSEKKLEFGLIDPFIYGCFQKNQSDLDILYKQKDCSISSFIITTKARPLESINDINGINITILGQSRAVIMAKNDFPKDGPIKFKNAYLSNNPSHALKDLKGEEKIIDAIFVLGFKRKDFSTIPFMKVIDQASMDDFKNEFKIINQKDYNIPCYLFATSQKHNQSIDDLIREKVLNEINTDEGMPLLVEGSEKFEAGDFSELKKTITEIVEKGTSSEINAETVKTRIGKISKKASEESED